MKANDRARLTTDLRGHVAKIAADLRGKMRAPGAARAAAEQLHKDERVAEDFEIWTDLLSRRAAVLWVLKSVYVRVLEDRGLLAPGRLLDPEAQQLFEKLAPNLGETAFLRWIYKDLASTRGGLPELFSPQPAEVALPSDELSRALIGFWRHRDADTGAVWSFAEERFEGELMGDLYQELDPVVKDRFALCQTPDFVRAFILDRTLTPAVETFGADEVRLLDPACGSGHFLIDGLKRLVAATAETHGDWSKEKIVAHALDRVVGIDLNDYACALSRTRLIMTAADLAGVTKLADAARFHPHVYWADGLEQVEKEEQKPPLQFSLFEKSEQQPRASLTRSDVRAALKKVFETKFHAVVANPPFITEKDAARKEYHRERVGKSQRYRSAYRDYSLGSPFVERCFQLAESAGYVGVITSNNFMKRDFGKPLIESVLAMVDLALVVDTSRADVRQRDTTTVMLFGRNSRPHGDVVRVVMGKRGETSTHSDPSTNRVWASIVEGWDVSGFDNEFVTVADVHRSVLSAYPWNLQGGGARPLKARIEAAASDRVRGLSSDIGRTNVCGEDPVFKLSRGAARRLGVGGLLQPFVVGEAVRDWSIASTESAVYPYLELGGAPIPADHPAVGRYFWRYRALLRGRSVFGKTPEERGGMWFEHLEHYKQRLQTPLAIAFPFVATHNHFALDRGGKIFNRTAPVLKLSADATMDEHFALLGMLNSSTIGFWLRQECHPKGGQSTGRKRQSETWATRLEYDAKKVWRAPVTAKHRERVVEIARRLDTLARELRDLWPSALLYGEWEASKLPKLVEIAQRRIDEIRPEMIAWQEELDWTVYVAFGLAGDSCLSPLSEIEPQASEHRAFAIHLARSAGGGSHWFEAMHVSPVMSVPESYSGNTRSRIEARLALIASDCDLRLLESPEFKRKWEHSSFSSALEEAAHGWMADRVESAIETRGRPATISHLAAALQDDARFLALASLCQNRRDVDIASLIDGMLAAEAVPSHPAHIYTESGHAKRTVWEDIWALQRKEDTGEDAGLFPPIPEYSQGSRGKSTDFLRPEYWQIRGKLDVPAERFIAFTEIPGRTGAETLYGWAGWTAQQRVKVILAIDEELEDASVPLADRIGLLDSAWRLLPDVAREDSGAATRLKAELQALVGPQGPSRELIEDWKKRFPPPTTRAARARKAAALRDEEDGESEESDES
jgi:hypothetical protein